MQEKEIERRKADGTALSAELETFLTELVEKLGGKINDAQMNMGELLQLPDILKVQEAQVRITARSMAQAIREHREER